MATTWRQISQSEEIVKRVNHIKFRFDGPEGDVDAAMKFVKDAFVAVGLVLWS